MEENKKSTNTGSEFDPAELLRAYSESLGGVQFGGKDIPLSDYEKPKGYVEPKAKPEHDQMVEKIIDKRSRLSKSVWTDEPLLKPQKSVWLDDDNNDEVKQPSHPVKKQGTESKPVQPAAPKIEKNVEKVAEPPKSNLIPQEKPEGYGEVIMPITSEFSSPKRLPRPEKQVAKNTQQFEVKIPKSYINEFDKGADMNTRPVKRDEIPKSVPRREEKKVTPQQAMSDRQKAEEYAKQVRMNALRIRNQANAANAAKAGAGAAVKTAGGTRPTVRQGASGPANAQRRPVSQTQKPKAPLTADEILGIKPNKQPERTALTSQEQRVAKGVYKPTTDTKATMAEYERMLERKKKDAAEKLKKDTAEAGYKTHALEFNFINALICILIIFGIAITLLIMTIMGKRETVSESEKRNLATFPKFSISSYFKGDFTDGISTYFTDTIPNRENFKKFCAEFTNCLGVTIGDTKINGSLQKVEKETLDKDKLATTTTVKINTDVSKTTTTADKDKTTTKKSTTEKLIDVPENLDEGQFLGDVIVSGKGENVRAVSAYYGTFENGDYYSETLNKWKEDLGDSVNVYNMSIPLSGAYYMPSNLKDQMSDQKDNIDNINAGLKGVAAVNVYNELAKHTDEYIYSRTDHHWQPLGAYYAGKVFADIAGVDYASLDEYDKFEIEDFVGTMYAYSNYDQALEDNPDTFTYYKPKQLDKISSTYYDTSFSSTYEPGASDVSGLFYDYASGANCYSAILNRDDEIVEINTGCTNGRVLVIFKDSFGNALAPFLTSSFSKIYVCDFRYFDINGVQFCKDVGATDLLFAVSLMSCSTPAQVDCISNDRIK